jgi:transposase
MRGFVDYQPRFVTLTPEDVVPENHPIRKIRAIVNEALAEMNPTFDRIYSTIGRPSIPPERLIKAMLLVALYTIRSERQLCERLQYDLLFKWFLEFNIDDEIFNPSTFSKNRDRLLDADVTSELFSHVVDQARNAGLLSEDHFSVDGTLLDAWASQKSVRPKDEPDDEHPDLSTNNWVDFSGTKRTNETHASITDPEALLARKSNGEAARPRYCGHALIENRNGLVVATSLSQATGTAERQAALELMKGATKAQGTTLAADKSYDTKDFVTECRDAGITPHVAAKKKHSAIDGRTTRHIGYAISQRRRKLSEQIFGWGKTVGASRKLRFIGVNRCSEQWFMTMTGFNLVRMAKLMQ